MKKVPEVLKSDIDGLSLRGLGVTGLEVVLATNRPALILSLEVLHSGGQEVQPYYLSPPAAKQLSRLLDEAVEGYLEGGKS